MSSVVEPQPERSNHDELVAYLDGELGPEDCRLVEERLASDDEYRQQLRDLDQAWEAPSALPTTAVDDGFARTTIELACVAAEKDLSQQTRLTAVENRNRTRWWIAGGVAAAVMGFVMVRALAVHRNNLLLADLPVIEQVNTLSHVSDIEFLRQLSQANIDNELVKDNQEFDRNVSDFKQASSPSLADRREWVDSLTPELKADLADRTRAFEELRQNPQENVRLRRLSNEIGGAKDAAALQKTLVAYGEWLSSPRHTAGDQEQLRKDLQSLSTSQQVDTIKMMVQRENEQAARQLSKADVDALRHEIFELAREKKAQLLEELPPGSERTRVTSIEANNVGPALYILREALRNDENSEATVNRLLGKLSKDANDHWNKLLRRDLRWGQLSAWIHEAMQTQWGPADLEKFFASDTLSYDKKQELLNMPKAKMNSELERLYLRSQLHIDDRWPILHDFGEAVRGRRNGPRGPGLPEGGRPGAGPDRRPEGPPPDESFRPDGPVRGRFDRERPPGPDGRRGCAGRSTGGCPSAAATGKSA